MIIQLNEYTECTSETCLFRFECAQHCTAGDFRTEDGISPDIYRSNGIVDCKTADDIYRIDYTSLPIEVYEDLNIGFVSDIPDLGYDPIHLGM